MTCESSNFRRLASSVHYRLRGSNWHSNMGLTRADKKVAKFKVRKEDARRLGNRMKAMLDIGDGKEVDLMYKSGANVSRGVSVNTCMRRAQRSMYEACMGSVQML